MIYRKFSKRQLLAMTWWNRPRFQGRDAIICDGSIRSGKTLSMTVGFLLWSMARFDGERFALCGKTIESLRRNVVTSIPDWLEGVFTVTEYRSENKLVVSNGTRSNTYYLFGGRDERSYTLIQGITLAGVLLDEVALMPRSFVEQALARCSVAGSKFWFNCNPEGPEHWFYKEWIKGARKHNALHLHFTMEDNPSLAPEIKARNERMYSGVFHQRYILGEWAVAQGLVYAMFDFDSQVLRGPVEEKGLWYISIDYGTQNPTSMGLWLVDQGKAVRVREYYHSGRDSQCPKTDEEYYRELEKLAGGRIIQYVIVDPSAASFIQTIKRHGRFSVRQADNRVLDGIRNTATVITQQDILVHESCQDFLREIKVYCWDERAGEDRVIKENDHAMDDMRYFVQTVLARLR